MKYFLIVIIFLLSFESFANDKINSKVIEISKNLRCLVCQGQSINDSDSDFALDVKFKNNILMAFTYNYNFNWNEVNT